MSFGAVLNKRVDEAETNAGTDIHLAVAEFVVVVRRSEAPAVVADWAGHVASVIAAL